MSSVLIKIQMIFVIMFNLFLKITEYREWINGALQLKAKRN